MTITNLEPSPPFLLQQHQIRGQLMNRGSLPLTSYTLNYQVNGEAFWPAEGTVSASAKFSTPTGHLSVRAVRPL